MNSGEKPVEPHAPAHGSVRRFLKLMVEIDSSRFALSRIRAALMLLAVLAAFGAIGYAVPALLSHYFR